MEGGVFVFSHCLIIAEGRVGVSLEAAKTGKFAYISPITESLHCATILLMITIK